MLNFVLCDDNKIILDKLSKMLESIFIQHNYEAKVAFTCHTAEDLMNYLQSNSADVLFLDIKLDSHTSGLDLANQIRKNNKNLYLIFTTGHLEYALLAYQVKTFDYLTKPISLERLEQTINRLFDDMQTSSTRFIRIGTTKILAKEKDIYYIKKDGMKLIYHASYRDYESYISFSKILPLLPQNFVRCHKSYIINLNAVRNLDLLNNLIFFDSNIYCPIGPKYKNYIMEVFNNHEHVKHNLECINSRK